MDSNKIRISRRFRKSIRIDTDLFEDDALEGFVCPQSSKVILLSMIQHVVDTGQGAFTWTGPYGCGKSSLAIAFCALIRNRVSNRRLLESIFDRTLIESARVAFPKGENGWSIVPVVGRKDESVRVIGEAFQNTGLVNRKPRGGWNETNLIATINRIIARQKIAKDGLILFVDEMGKLLEGAAYEGNDIHIFQQLAEIASRSNGKFLIVGILHQSFAEYAQRLTHTARDEWGKVQGRFVDLPVNPIGDEQIELIAHAIKNIHEFDAISSSSKAVAKYIRRNQDNPIEHLAQTLDRCLPLHPIVACLLGPISRRRFGQNQRSIFGFLNSSETHGFQEFLNERKVEHLYSPDRLWDYLRANLEPSILASPDGHRWALASDALERCEISSKEDFQVTLLKTIAIIDLFKERSGLVANAELLQTCFPGVSSKKLEKALSELDRKSFTIYRKFSSSHTVFAGSDFNFEQAIELSLEEITEIDFGILKSLAGLQPILAKRHYHATGAMRWFDVNLIAAKDALDSVDLYAPNNSIIGQFLLIIPTENESEDSITDVCRLVARQSGQWDIIAGHSKRSWTLFAYARELIALDTIRNNHPELQGDPVARLEVSARFSELQNHVEHELNRAIDQTSWYRKNYQAKKYRQTALNKLASDLADKRFNQSPILHNELLNRTKPSASAIAAQNNLLARMVLNDGEPRLGIRGFPAEGGLFASILDSTGIYISKFETGYFKSPSIGSDPCKLKSMWEEANVFLEKRKHRPVSISELIEIWRLPPFGIKDGLVPIITVAFIVSQIDKFAIYREGVFRAKFDDVDVEHLAKHPADFQLRWMSLNEIARQFLSEMAVIVRLLDSNNTLVDLEPIDVARGLVAIYDSLPKWTKRTMQLSSNAIKIRNMFKHAFDPNMFIFNDIPSILDVDNSVLNEDNIQQITSGLKEGLEELVTAYPSMLHRLRDLMLTELQVPNSAPRALADLRNRATNIKQLSGNFRLEAFVGRIVEFDGTDFSFESIASLVTNKSPRDWNDADLNQAQIETVDMAQEFLRNELYTRVKGRPINRESISVLIGKNNQPTPIHSEFEVTNVERERAGELAENIVTILETSGEIGRNVILAALADLSTRYMVDETVSETKMIKKQAVT